MKCTSKPVREHGEVPLADDGHFEDLTARWSERQQLDNKAGDGHNACYVVSIALEVDDRGGARLDEILGLVRAQGDLVVGHEERFVAMPDPRMLLGRGLAAEIGDRAAQLNADLLVVDAELSPSQLRNLEDATGLSVSDREAVILKVFQRHARTRRSKIQVEIAHLEYLRPRIRGLGLQMDQQAGGLLKARGPGETASELLARRLDGRLADLKKVWSKLQRADEVQRKRRGATRRIALVGYTNAGKTTLMNALTGAQLSARDQPFETLDATSRCLTRHGGDVLLSDTVGFIRRLPERLMASFESTLMEISEASLLAIVVDASDPERMLHLSTAEAMLERLGAHTVPRFYVFNKIDRMGAPPPQSLLRALSGGRPCFGLSGHDPDAAGCLRDALVCAARGQSKVHKVFVPYAANALIAKVYAQCRVIDAKSGPRGLEFKLEGPAHVLAQISKASKEAQR